MKLSNARMYQGKGLLRGYANLTTNDGVVVKGVNINESIQKDGTYFCKAPQKPGTGKNEGKYFDTVTIPAEVHDNLNKQATDLMNALKPAAEAVAESASGTLPAGVQ